MSVQHKIKSIYRLLGKALSFPFLILIQLYQKTVSPDHGFFKTFFPHGYCPFFPSCSEYAYQSILQKGLVRGGFAGLWRILRCHPWTKGGIDNV